MEYFNTILFCSSVEKFYFMHGQLHEISLSSSLLAGLRHFFCVVCPKLLTDAVTYMVFLFKVLVISFVSKIHFVAHSQMQDDAAA